jgi:hypothetical protein
MTIEDNATKGEIEVARWLLEQIIGNGYYVTIHSEETKTPDALDNIDEIMDHFAETEYDYVHIVDVNGVDHGWFLLVWGNETNGEELIADFSDNTLCQIVFEAVMTKIEGKQ